MSLLYDWKIGQNISKSLSRKYSQKPLNHAKQSATEAPKIASKRAFQEQQKHLVIWLVIKFLVKLQEVHYRVV